METLAPGGHLVQFYEHDEDLIDLVGRTFAPRLSGGEAAVLIGTAAHLEQFMAILDELGVDVDRAIAEHRLLLHDARQTLDSLLIDGNPNRAALRAAFAGELRTLAEGGRAVSIFGEMVALLWETGDVQSALELEAHWNELITELPVVVLLCAYPAQLFSATDRSDIARVCQSHSQVIVARPLFAPDRLTRRFRGTARAPGLARRFVAETLRAWRLEDVLDDCAVVVSELATNAVMHAHSDFTVTVSRTVDGVRVSVADGDDTAPIAGNTDPWALGGRGLQLVAALAHRWGHLHVADGKIVWADVASASSGV
ncbi:MAG TPA: MEDS domain-containing protein [Acidimicrobiia bacterium]|nr:MEDS domain-containing protein [Acidimicrobiia bacterium]